MPASGYESIQRSSDAVSTRRYAGSKSIQAEKEEFTFKTLLTQRVSLALLLFNTIGAVTYVVAASPSRAIPQEKGAVPITGEPFVWFAAIFPIVAGFLLLNLAWGALILGCRRWSSGRYWLSTIPLWLVAVLVDFAQH
jgi:hypothetical protein